jgi:hypothetical protein
MQLGKWGNQITAANYKTKMLCFKFGSVVGVDLNGTAFSTANIKFNPTVGVTISSTYSTVPSYTAADYTAGVTNVSATNYHTAANVKLGKGDPCKLVGLTVAQVKAGVIDNKSYRLPTTAENVAFVGSSEIQPTGSDYYTWIPNGENATNPGVGILHKGTANGTKLPAAGGRYQPDGEVVTQGLWGMYRASTTDGTSGDRLRIYVASLSPSGANNDGYTRGYPVRCVPQS